ncbi:MAG TPA: glucose-6-phosphate dehydrogenase [Steroidobacteraceae bacterium]
MARDRKPLHSAKVEPCVLTIFGVTGDLTKRLLLPSLYNLAASGSLPEDFRLVGVGRRDWNDAMLRSYLQDSLQHFLGGRPEARVTGWLAQRIFYQQANFHDQAGFDALAVTIRRVAAEKHVATNRLYYLAVAPGFVEQIVHKLGQSGQVNEARDAWARVIVEKPFGHDLASATALNQQLLKTLTERQIYRIDHFAGKDAVQDLAVFRFSNAIIEPLWHRSLIDSVQITASETVGVEERAEFYEHTGALRDMVPNHLMELLSHIAMEPPVSFSVPHMREKQIELLESVRQIRPRDVNRHAVRAQYSGGKVGRKSVPGYRREEGVRPRSQTETYVALQLEIDNWRWSGVPFFLRTGKRMAKSVTEIAVQFRQAPARLFPNVASGTAPPNQIVFQMKPNQGIHVAFAARAPGLENQVMAGDMAFEFPAGPFGSSAKGYERPLRDAMLGDPILFPNAAFIEQGWKLVQPLLDAWSAKTQGAIAQYPAGSQGPREAEVLLARSGHSWRALR